MGGARHFTELVAWQLADQLRVQILALTNRPGYARDLRLHGQTEDAIQSVCRNIAEGFGCESHVEFARFLGISRRSLNEVQDALRGAEIKGYVTGADLEAVRGLSKRLYPALGGLIAYLRRTADWKRSPPSSAATARTRKGERRPGPSVIRNRTG